MFFRIYGTGSGGENRKWSNLSSGGQNLSVEGYYITVGQFSDFLEGLISVSAHCAALGWLGDDIQVRNSTSSHL